MAVDRMLSMTQEATLSPLAKARGSEQKPQIGLFLGSESSLFLFHAHWAVANRPQSRGNQNGRKHSFRYRARICEYGQAE